MRVTLTSESFTEITVSKGTVQNLSPQASIEIVTTETKNSGLVLFPRQKLTFSNETTIYARSVWDTVADGETVILAVEPIFNETGGGGESYTLPIASASKLGGIKVGNNLSIDPNTGVLSGTAVSGGQNYSTTEQQIGTWIDGNPLYQITYNATAPSTINTPEEIAELPANVDSTNVVDVKFILHTAIGYVYPTSFYLSATDMDMLWIRANKKIVMQVGATGHTNTTVYITIQYTKTTD